MAENWRFLGLVNYAFILSGREVLVLEIIENEYELFQGFFCKSSLKVSKFDLKATSASKKTPGFLALGLTIINICSKRDWPQQEFIDSNISVAFRFHFVHDNVIINSPFSLRREMQRSTMSGPLGHVRASETLGVYLGMCPSFGKLTLHSIFLFLYWQI